MEEDTDFPSRSLLTGIPPRDCHFSNAVAELLVKALDLFLPGAPGLYSETWDGTRLPRRVDADEQHVVALQFDGLLIGEGDRLAGPEVFAGLRAVEA